MKYIKNTYRTSVGGRMRSFSIIVRERRNLESGRFNRNRSPNFDYEPDESFDLNSTKETPPTESSLLASPESHRSKMNGGPSGFNNAPVTRGFVVASALFTIFFGIRGRSNNSLTALSYQDIFEKLRLWKFVASIFAFSSTPELIFGLYLLYYFRVFERQIGSNKYSVFVLFSVLVSLGLQILALAFFKDPSMNILSSGPYGLIFSSFIPFFFDIPISTRFHVLGVHFSDKSFIYLAGLQLFLSSWKRSMLPGLCGILAGSLYRMNFLCIRKMKFPQAVASFFSGISLPSLGTSPAVPSRNGPPTASANTRRPIVEGNYPSPVASLFEPPEDSISTLVSMGFDRSHARQALVQARNDINAATNILLEAQSH